MFQTLFWKPRPRRGAGQGGSVHTSDPTDLYGGSASFGDFQTFLGLSFDVLKICYAMLCLLYHFFFPEEPDVMLGFACDRLLASVA